MRRSIAAAGFLIVAVVGGCAAGTPTVGAEPADPTEAVAETMPLEWFVENWGPFDAALVGSVGNRTRPLVLIDGVQVDQRSPDQRVGPHPLEDISNDDLRHIRIVKGHSGAGLFGEAACAGIIMLFTHDYDGPMPITPKLANPPPCRRGAP